MIRCFRILVHSARPRGATHGSRPYGHGEEPGFAQFFAHISRPPYTLLVVQISRAKAEENARDGEHECRLRGTDRGGPCVLAGDATVVPRVSQDFGRDVGLRAVQGPRFPELRWPRTVAVGT